jgi:uncharacterized protein YfiM (DUF2279 family)
MIQKPVQSIPASANDSGLPERKSDRTFRRIVVFSTALGFALALGSEACLERGVDHGYDFHWHWRALFWMAVGVAVGVQLWRLVWRVEADNTAKNRSHLGRFCVVIILGALAVFVYPILFVTGPQLKDVIFGLCLAVAVLTFVFWMITRVFKGFVESDAEQEVVATKKL